MLQIPPTLARSIRLPWSALIANKLHEFWTKATGRRIKGQGMIGAAPGAVRDGFASLIGADFDEYNLPQSWVERRQIPRVLHRRVPKQRASILDLGCGPGTSTEVIAHFAHPSWEVIGYDLTPHLIEAARSRAEEGGFKNHQGEAIAPTFVCQNIAAPLMRNGSPIPDASIDLALSGGVVGLYLRRRDAITLVRELRRVVKPGGHIALDAGPSIPERLLRALAERHGFEFIERVRSFWIEPRPKLVFRRA